MRRRDFGLLLAGQSVSVFGDRLVMVAMPFAVLTIPGAGLSSVGLVLGASAFSLALFVLVGGVYGDRLPRQLTMLTRASCSTTFEHRPKKSVSCWLLAAVWTSGAWSQRSAVSKPHVR